MISINNINKKFKRKTVLSNVSLEVNPGECVGIIGANGSGKTTLLSIICGILKADSGDITIDGEKLNEMSFIGYVPQENPLIPELTAYDNLLLWHKGTKKDLKENLKSGILHTLNIDDFYKKKVSSLSGGMKKRLSIGIALMSNPKLLILDEPGASLDIKAKYEIRKYIEGFIKDKNGSVIITSHDMYELEMCNKLYILKDSCLTQTNMSIDSESFINSI